ncbi:MAG: hypothetical protein ABMB14_19320 [Myxococcota bacterium]
MSANIARAIKVDGLVGDPPQSACGLVAKRLAERDDARRLRELFEGAALVPVPRSSLHREGSPWPGMSLCEAMRALGLGDVVIRLLERRSPVRKAATASRGARPTADDHRGSLSVASLVVVGRPILLVDDVVTTGAQLFGAAEAIREASPGAVVMGFAAVRTRSDGDVDALIEPVVGTIRMRGDGRTHRDP